MNKMPIYEFCCSFEGEIAIPLCICRVEHLPFESSKYPNGFIKISYEDLYEDINFTGLLKCYISKKGKYAIWGKHRFYEGYEGGIILRGYPHDEPDFKELRRVAESYGSIVE